MKKSKLLVLAFILAMVALFFSADLGRYLTLTAIHAHQAAIQDFRAQYPWQTTELFFFVYVGMTALSLPGATILTLLAGAIFGLAWGTVLVSFASSIGATLACLMARFLLRDWVKERFFSTLREVNAGIARDGTFYLFSLRMIPVVPFFVINLVMGLTELPITTFYWVSQTGMLAGTLVYVNAGTQLSRIETLSGIFSPVLFLSFTMLGLLPLVARILVERLRLGRTMAAWPKPKRFDRNLVVIGAGAAGLVTAYIAAAAKAKVTLVEKDRMGGDCLNTGCVPSKAMIRSARLLADLHRSQAFGLGQVQVEVDFPAILERIRQIIAQVAPHDSVERYTALGVECLQGEARVLSPYEVAITSPTGTVQCLTSRSMVIAAGASPIIPPIPGLAEMDYRTSADIWNLTALPQRLLVLGGGPIGAELAQCFARFGSQVTLVQSRDRLLPREDPEVSALVLDRFRQEGIDCRLSHRPKRFFLENGEKRLLASHQEGESTMTFDGLLLALGRKANTSGYGLEKMSIALEANGTIGVDPFLATRFPNILVAGDAAGPYQFTHVAAHQAWYAAINALFGGIWRFKVDYRVIPWTTFTDPEVARVGLNEQEALAQGIPHHITRFHTAELDRSITDGSGEGLVKVLTVPGKDRILGVTIVGEHAGERIAEFVLAMRHGLGLKKILATIHTYPTWSEANKSAAGIWQQEHAPLGLLALAKRYHTWRRG